ncbi:MAG: type I secretion system permease/ATPase, partial [gamma proteobacterium symbiont of Phacoides pectinatus]
MSQDPSHNEREWQIADDGSVFDDPLLDCLVVLAQHHGRPLSHEALRAGLPLTDEGLTPELFVRAAERHGFSARILKRKLTRIDNLLLPAVLILSGKKACILLEIDREGDRLRIVETETGTGEYWVDRAELEQRYLGYAIFVRAEYRFDQRTPDLFKVKTSNWFWGTLGKSWRIYRDVLLASF